MEICLIQFQYYVAKSSSYLDSMDNHLQGNDLRNRNRVILCSCYAVVVLKVHFGQGRSYMHVQVELIIQL